MTDRSRAWSRAVVDRVDPQVDGGRFPVKRTVGDRVTIEADAFTDGHDRIRCRLMYRAIKGEGASVGAWQETEMLALGNDRWRAHFVVDAIGRYEYTVAAWVDAFVSWRHDFERRVDEDDIRLALRTGVRLITEAAQRASNRSNDAGAQEALDDAQRLTEAAARLAGPEPLGVLRDTALSDTLQALVGRHPDRTYQSVYAPVLPLVCDPALARFSAWYELFPRSSAERAGEHGTFASVQALVPRIAGMGFNVLYLPPIHPIGREKRKGPNNALTAGPDDPGSPWAIGAAEGGHTALHPQLGSEDDFKRLVQAARAQGVQLALDIAFQCAPDHPWVKEHPQWFRRRPDGSVQYAENPPKKYQDIYPLEFENDDWEGLFDALLAVFRHWIGLGVTVFRVDNPHTKPFAFWEWVIGRIKKENPEVIFLAEAFTRPRVMHRLAKAGFSQSYTYFTWRNTREELAAYMTEVCRHESREYFRPNFWPNTPDILTEYLQTGGRAGFMVRLVLAAMMTANYGVYGPAYEAMEDRPREPGSEEYLDSEKYEIRHRGPERPDSLSAFMTRINRIRRDNPALQQDWNAAVLETDNPQLFGFTKFTEPSDRAGPGNRIVVVVNLDPHNVQSGHLHLPAKFTGVDESRSFQAHDLLTDQHFIWSPGDNYVRLDPGRGPAHVLLVRSQVRDERDVDNYS